MTRDPSLPSEPAPALPPAEPVVPPSQSDPVVPPESAVEITRAAALWSALILGFLILVLLAGFFNQKIQSAEVHPFAREWNPPTRGSLSPSAGCGGPRTFPAAARC